MKLRRTYRRSAARLLTMATALAMMLSPLQATAVADDRAEDAVAAATVEIERTHVPPAVALRHECASAAADLTEFRPRHSKLDGTATVDVADSRSLLGHAVSRRTPLSALARPTLVDDHVRLQI